MNTRLFPYFLALYEWRSLGKASQGLGISQMKGATGFSG